EADIRKKLIPIGAIVNDDTVMESLDSDLAVPGTKSEAVKITKKKDNTPDSYSNVFSSEEFDSMLTKAEEKAKELAGDILAGCIDINPYLEKKKTACDYCPIRGYCGFDVKLKGYDYRKFDESEPGEENEE
ncbi:MAG: PD-(D/E)XK nuclease family protein, partial [Lachnospiraceae bacterium]|nr:PD-(D/E)XK nuclease family protein [Lachnospiraceae bacterium]